jgi:hypothetical protein
MITFIESPYFGVPHACRYAACCELDAFQRWNIPIASHIIYPLALPEHVNVDLPSGEAVVAHSIRTGRELGIGAASALKAILHAARVEFSVTFYTDLPWSQGMRDDHAEASRCGYQYRYEQLHGQAQRAWLAGEWPTMARLTPNHEVSDA